MDTCAWSAGRARLMGWRAALVSCGLVLAALAGLAAAGALEAEAAGRPTVAVEDVRDVSHFVAEGHKVKELSGLAWDEDEQVLYAVSDKGVLFHLAFASGARDLAGIGATFASRLTGVDGRPIDRSHANAEGLAVRLGSNGVRGDSELLIAFESGSRIARVSPEGRLIAYLPVPAPLGDPALLKAEGRGLEAIAEHPALGIVVATEQPLATDQKGVHVIRSSSGRSVAFAALNGGKGRIKAIDVLPGGQLLVLERFRRQGTEIRQVVPRLLDPAACGSAVICPTREPDDEGSQLPEGNFEGLAVLGADRFIVVSDEFKNGLRSTRLVIFRLSDAGR